MMQRAAAAAVAVAIGVGCDGGDLESEVEMYHELYMPVMPIYVSEDEG